MIERRAALPLIHLLVALSGAGCTALPVITIAPAQQPAAPPSKADLAPGAPPPVLFVPPGGLKPFKEVVKSAKLYPGLFDLYQKDEKVWLDIKPEQFNQPFFLSINRTHRLADNGFMASPMLRGHIVEFRKIGNLVQLVAKNYRYTAKEGSPIARAVRENFSDSLLAAAPVVSQPDADKKSVLIDVNALLLADIPMAATALESAFHIPYSFDPRNSSFDNLRATADMAGFQISAHYSVARIPSAAMSSTSSLTAAPTSLEDNRSLFLGFYYSLAKLPEPMAARRADDRIGHFVTKHWNYSDDIQSFPREYFVNRWRLDKKDTEVKKDVAGKNDSRDNKDLADKKDLGQNAEAQDQEGQTPALETAVSDAAVAEAADEFSEPKQPIVFWLDRNIPEKYRGTVAAGILEWNKAFEKIGFKDAIRVEIQPENADFYTGDLRHTSVRWVVDTSDSALAIGPTRVDPRTGEILDADIEISQGWTRLPRRVAVEQLPGHTAQSRDPMSCAYAAEKMDDISFALDLLGARGDLEPGSPEAEAVVRATLKDVVTHEVGHTLGLRHNFRASTIYSLDQIADKGFTHDNGLGGSVMDYNGFNIATHLEKQGEYVMSTLGPYDYWAIEYAYKPLKPGTETRELARIAARSSEPTLAFGTDEDAGFGGAYEGMDPEVNRRDLGNDPLAFAQKRLALSRELWDRLQDKQLADGESYDVLRRNFEAGMRQVGAAAVVAAKYVGGVVNVRDHAGSNRTTLTPIAAAKQRTALKLLAEGLFTGDSFNFKAEFMSRMTVDNFERGQLGVQMAVTPDFSLGNELLGVQSGVLDQLLSDSVATRILEANFKLKEPKQAFRLSELYDVLQTAIWKELKTNQEINLLRRSLQREHLRRLVAVLLSPSTGTPADARALQRENARELVIAMKAAEKRPGLSKESKAHIAESANTLEEALKAPLQRAGI